MMGTIVCVTGRTGAGKSTIVKTMAEEFSMPFHGFGNYERQKWLEMFGYKSPAEYWTKLGLERGHFSLYPEHIAQVRDRVTESGIAVESIYSVTMLDLLRTEFPDHRAILVGAIANDELRFERFRARESVWTDRPEYEFKVMEGFKVRIGMLVAMERAEFVIENEGSIGSLREKIRDLGNELRLIDCR